MKENLHARSRDEDTSIHDPRFPTRNTHYETHQDKELEGDNENRAFSDAVREVCCSYTADGCENIDGHGEELRVCGLVT
jgi:hypothetical protein